MNQPNTQNRRQAPPRPANTTPTNGASASPQAASGEDKKTRVRRSASERADEERRKQEKRQREYEAGQRRIAELERQERLKALTDKLSNSEDKELRKKVKKVIECERSLSTLTDASEILADLKLSTEVLVPAMEKIAETRDKLQAELEAAASA